VRKFLRFLAWTVAISGAVVGILCAFAIRFFTVPDDLILAASVRPNLEGGDLVILWRLTAPKYGDLVVCPEPDNPGEFIVGRLLAEPGDTIEVKGDRIWVNAAQSETEMACPGFETVDPDTEAKLDQHCSVEVTGTHRHYIGQTGGHKKIPKPVRDELMDGEIYLVSDNRLYPYDSRDYGAVQRDTCRETVIFRLVGPKGWGDGETRLTYIR
jgi:signal peptidase I